MGARRDGPACAALLAVARAPGSRIGRSRHSRSGPRGGALPGKRDVTDAADAVPTRPDSPSGTVCHGNVITI